MAVGASQTLISLEAGADLSASTNQFCFVKITDDNTVGLATAATDQIIGILQNRPKQGEAASVCVGGRSKLRASAAIADGSAVTATTGGEGVTTTTAEDIVGGIALTTVAAADTYVDVLVVHTAVPGAAA